MQCCFKVSGLAPNECLLTRTTGSHRVLTVAPGQTNIEHRASLSLSLSLALYNVMSANIFPPFHYTHCAFKSVSCGPVLRDINKIQNHDIFQKYYGVYY